MDMQVGKTAEMESAEIAVADGKTAEAFYNLLGTQHPYPSIPRTVASLGIEPSMPLLYEEKLQPASKTMRLHGFIDGAG